MASVVDKPQGGNTKRGGATGGTDWVARARALAPMIAEAAPETEKGGQVTDAVMAAMHEAKLWRLALPRWLDGAEASMAEIAQVCETVAAADASTAWCLGQGLGCTLPAAYIDPDVAKDIYGAPDAVLAWGPPGKAKAVKVDGGYRVTGRWRFASGSRHATWMGSHCRIFEDEDTPAVGPSGGPVVRTMMYPKSSATMVDVWQVVGLRGTGSDDYMVEDLFVPAGYSYARDSDAERRETGALYRIPLLTFYGMAFSALALGIARATLDEFIPLAATKVPGGSSVATSVPLRENAVVQAEVAKCEARLRSARAFLFETIDAYCAVLEAGDAPSLELRATLRTSITWGSNQAREVANYAYQAAGTNAIFESNGFERRFRDMNTVSQQGQAHLNNLEDAGQVFLGLTPGGHRV